MVKKYFCAFTFPLLIAISVHAQENSEEELPPPSRITETQKLQAQEDINKHIASVVEKREPQQMKRILKASEQVEKSKIRQKNRFLPASEQIQYQEKNIDVKDKDALKKYFTETYITEPTEINNQVKAK